MRYHEIAAAFRIPVSGEEQDLLSRAEADDGLDSTTLDERDAEVARRMVGRGLFDQGRGKDGQEVFRVNSVKDIWRDN